MPTQNTGASPNEPHQKNVTPATTRPPLNTVITNNPIKPSAPRCAAVFGCTVEQAKRLFAKNADGLRWMAAKAEKTGKKYNGYTAAELRASEAAYREASQ